MRHRKKGKVLDRKIGPRRALLKGLASSLILHGSIETTAVKAKALRPLIERLITHGKKQTLAARRLLVARLSSETAAKKLFTDVAPKYTDRHGGYTRITKTGHRQGDGGEKARIEFV